MPFWQLRCWILLLRTIKNELASFYPPLKLSTGERKGCTIPFHIYHCIYIMHSVLHGANSFLPDITPQMEVSSWKNNTITIQLMPVTPQPYFHIISHQRGSYCGGRKGFFTIAPSSTDSDTNVKTKKVVRPIQEATQLFYFFSARNNKLKQNCTSNGVIGHFIFFFTQACNVADLKAIKACLPLLFTDHLQSMNY